MELGDVDRKLVVNYTNGFKNSVVSYILEALRLSNTNMCCCFIKLKYIKFIKIVL